MPCSLVVKYQQFRKTCCLLLWYLFTELHGVIIPDDKSSYPHENITFILILKECYVLGCNSCSMVTVHQIVGGMYSLHFPEDGDSTLCFITVFTAYFPVTSLRFSLVLGVYEKWYCSLKITEKLHLPPFIILLSVSQNKCLNDLLGRIRMLRSK
jgi:hypothetical protein